MDIYSIDRFLDDDDDDACEPPRGRDQAHQQWGKICLMAVCQDLAGPALSTIKVDEDCIFRQINSRRGSRGMDKGASPSINSLSIQILNESTRPLQNFSFIAARETRNFNEDRNTAVL